MSDNREVRIRISLDNEQYRRALNELGAVTRSTLSSLGSVLGGLGIGAAITSIGNAAIKAAGGFEQYKVSFEVMLKSSEAAKEHLIDLQAMAAQTPFELPELVEGSKRLIAFGISASEVVDRLKRLGDLSQGQADILDRLTLAYGKLRAKGKATLEELNMFTEAGVPLMDALARQFNVTTSQLFDMVSKGKVNFNDVDKALMSMTNSGGQFFGMMDKQAKTFQGISSTMRDDFTAVSRTLGEMLLPAAKSAVIALDDLAKSLNKAIKGASDWASSNQELIGSIQDGATALAAFALAIPLAKILPFITNIDNLAYQIKLLSMFMKAELIPAIIATTAALLANPWTWVAAGIAAAGAAIYLYTQRNKNLERAISDINARTDQQTSRTKDLLKQIEKLSSVENKNNEQKKLLSAAIAEITKMYPKYAQRLEEELRLKGKLSDKTKELIANEIILAKTKQLNIKEEKIQKEKDKYVANQNYGYAAWKTGLSYVDPNNEYDKQLEKIRKEKLKLNSDKQKILKDLSGIDVKPVSSPVSTGTAGDKKSKAEKPEIYNIAEGKRQLEELRKDLAEKSKLQLQSIQDEEAKLKIKSDVKNALLNAGVLPEDEEFSKFEQLLTDALTRERDITINSERELAEAKKRINEQAEEEIRRIKESKAQNAGAAIKAIEEKRISETKSLEITAENSKNAQLLENKKLFEMKTAELEQQEKLDDEQKQREALKKEEELKQEYLQKSFEYQMDLIQQYKDEQKKALDALEDSFQRSFDTIFDGTKNWKQKMASILQDLGKTLLEYILVRNQTNNAISSIPASQNLGGVKSSFLRSIGNAATNALFGIPLFHSGGTVSGANIPGTDETLALLKVGETVRTPHQEASLKSGQSVIVNFAPQIHCDDPYKTKQLLDQYSNKFITDWINAANTGKMGVRTAIRGAV